MLSRQHGDFHRLRLAHIVFRRGNFKYIVVRPGNASGRDIGQPVDSLAQIREGADSGRIRRQSGAAHRLIGGVQRENGSRQRRIAVLVNLEQRDVRPGQTVGDGDCNIRPGCKSGQFDVGHAALCHGIKRCPCRVLIVGGGDKIPVLRLFNRLREIVMDAVHGFFGGKLRDAIDYTCVAAL